MAPAPVKAKITTFFHAVIGVIFVRKDPAAKFIGLPLPDAGALRYEFERVSRALRRSSPTRQNPRRARSSRQARHHPRLGPKDTGQALRSRQRLSPHHLGRLRPRL